MPERSENEPTAAGQHAAVAAWSTRARLGVLVLVVGVVAAMTALILANRGSGGRAITSSSGSPSNSPAPTSPSASGTKGIVGSGIGPADSPTRRRAPSATATDAPSTSLAAFETAHPTQGTTTAAPRSSSSAPAPSAKPSPVQSTSAPPPAPSPTPKKRCIPNTKICLG